MKLKINLNRWSTLKLNGIFEVVLVDDLNLEMYVTFYRRYPNNILYSL